jgi:hypothetical protein
MAVICLEELAKNIKILTAPLNSSQKKIPAN